MSSLCSIESSFQDQKFKNCQNFKLGLWKKRYGNRKNHAWKHEIWLSGIERVKDFIHQGRKINLLFQNPV